MGTGLGLSILLIENKDKNKMLKCFDVCSPEIFLRPDVNSPHAGEETEGSETYEPGNGKKSSPPNYSFMLLNLSNGLRLFKICHLYSVYAGVLSLTEGCSTSHGGQSGSTIAARC